MTHMQYLKKCLWRKILPFCMVLLFYPYLLTLRVTQLELEPDLTWKPFRKDKHKKYIFGHWHEDIPFMCLQYSFSGFASMASRSRDGEFITRVLRFMGIKIIRGSSRHFGPETLKEISDILLQENKDFALAVDGPRGPRHKVKEGIFYIAHKTEKAIIPAAANAKHKWVFHKSWDQMWFPRPFSKCILMFGKPIHISHPKLQEEFQKQLKFLKENALSYYS